eukprot:8780109-Pyramimonas_sp.AAC.1
MITLPCSRCQTIGTKPKKGGGRPAAMHARRCPSNVAAANVFLIAIISPPVTPSRGRPEGMPGVTATFQLPF